jgi:hypothetical protein
MLEVVAEQIILPLAELAAWEAAGTLTVMRLPTLAVAAVVEGRTQVKQVVRAAQASSSSAMP